MGYLGRNPSIGTQKMLDSIESQFNGALATFDLRYGGVPTYPTLSESLIVSLGGVLQEPGEAYYVSSDKIVFSQAPQAGTECWILLYSQYGAATSATPSLAIQATGEPMGFENRTHSAISFNSGTRTFSIAPNTGAGHLSYAVWTKGTKRTISATLSVQVGTATGLYYIYFDAFGDLQYKTTYFTWDTETPVAYVYWNATTSSAPFVADERHGITLDWATHEYLHRTRGAVIAEGFGISNYVTTGDGSADAHAQFDLANGTFFDEDLEVAISHSATPTVGTFTQVLTGAAEIPVFYMSGADGAWVKDSATEYACKQSGTTLQYNSLSGGTWSTTPAGNNRYVVSWVVATNDINAPVICILGQEQYTAIGSAEEAMWGDLTLTNFPIVEFRPLWKVIFQTSTGFANTPNALIANVLDLRQLSETGEAGTVVSDHGLLSGLTDDDHSQYLHTTLTRAGVTANISTTGNLGGANLTLTGELRGPANFVIDPAAIGDDTGKVVIRGDFQVDGTTTTINSTTLTVDDKAIVVASGAGTAAAADGAGISVDGANATITYSSSGDSWVFNKAPYYNASRLLTIADEGAGNGLDADTLDGQQGSYYLNASNINAGVIGDAYLPATISSNITGNAATATKLATARSISLTGDVTGSVSFDGSANVSITAAVVNDSHTHDGRYYTEAEADARFLGINAKAADSNLLDGLNSGSFLRSDASDVATGPIAWDGTLATFDPPGGGTGTDTATDVAIALESGLRIAGWVDGYIRTLFKWTFSGDIEIGQGATSLIADINLLPGGSGVAKVNGNTIWHTGNDGSGSGLDADLLDGQQGSYYQPASTALTSSTTFGGDVSGTYNAIVVANDSHTHDGRYFTETESDARYLGISAKAADSNLLDGIDSSSFLRSDAADTASGVITFSNGNTTYGTSTALSAEFGVNVSAPGAIKLHGSTSGAYGLIQVTTSNLHIDTVVGGTYLNFYDGDFVSFGTGVGAESARFTGSTGTLTLGSITETGTASQRLQVTGGAYVSGNVGIGITNPSYKLDVSGDIFFYNNAIIAAVDGTSNIDHFWHNDSSSYGQGGIWNFVSDGTYKQSGSSAIRAGAFANMDDTGTANQKLQITGGTYISGNVGIGTTNPGYKLEVNGSFAATTKSFVIPHPTKEGYKLRYGSLEGEENGVYVRGKSNSKVIELPEYWTKLVDPDSITVSLTPIGKSQTLWVKDIKNNKVYVGSKCSEINYFYTIFAERIDVEKLEVEFPVG